MVKLPLKNYEIRIGGVPMHTTYKIIFNTCLLKYFSSARIKQCYLALSLLVNHAILLFAWYCYLCNSHIIVSVFFVMLSKKDYCNISKYFIAAEYP